MHDLYRFQRSLSTCSNSLHKDIVGLSLESIIPNPPQPSASSNLGDRSCLFCVARLPRLYHIPCDIRRAQARAEEGLQPTVHLGLAFDGWETHNEVNHTSTNSCFETFHSRLIHCDLCVPNQHRIRHALTSFNTRLERIMLLGDRKIEIWDMCQTAALCHYLSAQGSTAFGLHGTHDGP